MPASWTWTRPDRRPGTSAAPFRLWEEVIASITPDQAHDQASDRSALPRPSVITARQRACIQICSQRKVQSLHHSLPTTPPHLTRKNTNGRRPGGDDPSSSATLSAVQRRWEGTAAPNLLPYVYADRPIRPGIPGRVVAAKGREEAIFTRRLPRASTGPRGCRRLLPVLKG